MEFGPNLMPSTSLGFLMNARTTPRMKMMNAEGRFDMIFLHLLLVLILQHKLSSSTYIQKGGISDRLRVIDRQNFGVIRIHGNKNVVH